MSMYHFARKNLLSTITYVQMYEVLNDRKREYVCVCIFVCLCFHFEMQYEESIFVVFSNRIKGYIF